MNFFFSFFYYDENSILFLKFVKYFKKRFNRKCRRILYPKYLTLQHFRIFRKYARNFLFRYGILIFNNYCAATFTLYEYFNYNNIYILFYFPFQFLWHKVSILIAASPLTSFNMYMRSFFISNFSIFNKFSLYYFYFMLFFRNRFTLFQ